MPKTIRKDRAVLENSEKPRELVSMARVYAASRDPADQAVLLRYLGSTDFLNRLNTEEEYLRLPARNLDVARVIQTLMDQGTPEACSTLVGLTESRGFQSYDPLIELLIRGLAADIPASPRTVGYWNKHSQPDAVFVHVVVEVLFINRSEPALDLFAQILNNPGHDDECKEVWLRYDMLQKRNDTEVLRGCERMIIDQTVDPGWHQNILEALFDYTEAWYLSCRIPRPKPRVLAPSESKEVIKRLGRHALTNMELVIPGLREKIKLAMKEIGYDWDEESEDRAPA